MDNPLTLVQAQQHAKWMEQRALRVEAILKRLRDDHECCDPENCRFCLAVGDFA
jgi:hypothetical protein